MHQGLVLAELDATVNRVVANDDYLFASVVVKAGGSKLVRIELATTKLDELAGGDGALSLAIDAARLYVGTTSEVRACTLPCSAQGGGFITVASGRAFNMATATGFGGQYPIAWLDPGAEQISTPGSSQSTKKLADAKADRRGYIHASGEALYWTGQAFPYVGRLQKGNSTASTFDLGSFTGSDFAVVDDTIFFTSPTGYAALKGPLYRGRIGTTAIEDISKVGAVAVRSMIVDGANLLVLAEDGLYGCPTKDCKELTRIVRAPDNPDAGTVLMAELTLAANFSSFFFATSDFRIWQISR